MKFLLGKTTEDFKEYKQVEVNTVEELIEIINKSEWEKVVIYFRGEWWYWPKNQRIIEDYNDWRE